MFGSLVLIHGLIVDTEPSILIDQYFEWAWLTNKGVVVPTTKTYAML